MDIGEVKKFHAYAQALDGRIQAMDKNGVMAHAWHLILEDVPFVETNTILKHLYARPQMLVLQPGHVADAWEEIKAEREKVLAQITSQERYLRNFGQEDPPEVTAGKKAYRDKLIASLPEHARPRLDDEGFAELEYRQAVKEFDRDRDGDWMNLSRVSPEQDPRYEAVRKRLAGMNGTLSV